ncbi:unnamed protein product, partial [Heterosigma akashiwo]
PSWRRPRRFEATQAISRPWRRRPSSHAGVRGGEGGGGGEEGRARRADR